MNDESNKYREVFAANAAAARTAEAANVRSVLASLQRFDMHANSDDDGNVGSSRLISRRDGPLVRFDDILFALEQAALADPRPTGDGYDVARHNEWLEANAVPTGEQAGDVVAWRWQTVLNGVESPWRTTTDASVVERLGGNDTYRVQPLYAKPRHVGVPDALADPGNPWRRAVEHAGYLVMAVADYMEASANAGVAIEQVEGIEDPSDEQLEEMHSAQEDADEARTRMRDLSYEFTKRRDRAMATLAAAPEVPRG